MSQQKSQGSNEVNAVNKVSIVSDGIKFRLEIENGCICFETIQQCFPDACGLSYMEQDEVCPLRPKNGWIELPDLKISYAPFFANKRNNPLCAAAARRQQKFQDLLQDVTSDFSAKGTGNPPKNKKKRYSQELKEIKLKLAWKHLSCASVRPQQVHAPVGHVFEKEKLTLEEAEFSFRQMLDWAVRKMRTSCNELYFNKCKVLFCNHLDQQFSDFKDSSNNQCTFRQFSHHFRTSSSKISLYLLTIEIGPNVERPIQSRNASLDVNNRRESTNQMRKNANRVIVQNNEKHGCSQKMPQDFKIHRKPSRADFASSSANNRLFTSSSLGSSLESPEFSYPSINDSDNRFMKDQSNLNASANAVRHTSNQQVKKPIENGVEKHKPHRLYEQVHKRANSSGSNTLIVINDHDKNLIERWRGGTSRARGLSSKDGKKSGKGHDVIADEEPPALQYSQQMSTNNSVRDDSSRVISPSVINDKHKKLITGWRENHPEIENLFNKDQSLSKEDRHKAIGCRSSISTSASIISSKVSRDRTSKSSKPSFHLGSTLSFKYFDDDTSKLIVTSTNPVVSEQSHVVHGNPTVEDSVEFDLSLECILFSDLKFSQNIDAPDAVKLGFGAYGQVFKAEWLGTTVAVKRIQCHKNSNNLLTMREIKVMEKVRHPNIVSIMGYCIKDHYCYIVMEFVDGKDLRSILFVQEVRDKFGLDEYKLTYLALHLIKAFAYLHQLRPPLIHRDVKPENILVDKNLTLKLCDFGFCKPIGEIPGALNSFAPSRKVGTVVYSAPEIHLKNQPATTKSEIWAIAGVIKELHSKERFWDVLNCTNKSQRMTEIFKRRELPDLTKVPEEVRNILIPCFEYDPSKRPDIIHLLEAFKSREERLRAGASN